MGKKTLEFKSYEVTKIDANTWHIADQINSYIYLLEGEQKALLIDTGSGVLPLRPLIEKLTNKPIVVVNTHGHPDHVGANYEFDEVWISEKDAENAALEKTPYKNGQTVFWIMLLMSSISLPLILSYQRMKNVEKKRETKLISR